MKFEPSKPWNLTWFSSFNIAKHKALIVLLIGHQVLLTLSSILKNIYVCWGAPSTFYCVIRTCLKLHYLNGSPVTTVQPMNIHTYTHEEEILSQYHQSNSSGLLSIELLDIDNISLNELRQNKSLLRFKFELIIIRMLNYLSNFWCQIFLWKIVHPTGQEDGQLHLPNLLWSLLIILMLNTPFSILFRFQ